MAGHVSFAGMTALAENLKPQLNALSTEDRAALAQFLLSSLESQADAGAEAAWESELQRRAEEVRRGTATGRPAREAVADLRRKHS
jgi:putative addiction module component (TIGR02574 family)